MTQKSQARKIRDYQDSRTELTRLRSENARLKQTLRQYRELDEAMNSRDELMADLTRRQIELAVGIRTVDMAALLATGDTLTEMLTQSYKDLRGKWTDFQKAAEAHPNADALIETMSKSFSGRLLMCKLILENKNTKALDVLKQIAQQTILAQVAAQ